jgi:arylsulfatase A-like enzyme
VVFDAGYQTGHAGKDHLSHARKHLSA